MKVYLLWIAGILRRIAVFIALVKFRFKKITGLLGKPVIQPYYGYGNRQEVFVHGRVIENNILSKPIHKYRMWDNVIAMYKRYVSDSIPNTNIGISFNGQKKQVCSNSAGYFDATFQLEKPLDKDWLKVDFKLLDRILDDQNNVTASGHVMVSERNSQFGIISDVDDTILISKATKFIKKLRLLLLKNAHTRLPFEGVAAFYHALQKGKTGKYFNPIFYVSSSSWKLYDLLIEFCDVRGIPKGPFFLRTSRLEQFKFISSIHLDHKLQQIEKIMSMYPDVKFILIGDSGQKDPEIYLQVAKDFPGRVEAVFIRDISKDKRSQEIHKIGEKLFKDAGVELFYIETITQAAKHALSKGYISKDFIRDIIREKIEDEHGSDDPDLLMREEEEQMNLDHGKQKKP
jgi:phosphatidate phosphatase APP1